MDQIYKKLLTFSYNIVGSYDDAEDLVQDIIEKYIITDKSHIRNETNYLIRSIINHSINFKERNKRSARFGVWLPEPIATESPESKLIRENTASYSLMVLMEKLNARERSVFILKEGFDYSHEEIAQLMEISADNSRQLFSRAKKTLNQRSFKKSEPVSVNLQQYIDAIIKGNVKHLERLLMDDVRVFADGGNKVRVVKDFVMGKDETINLMLFVYNSFLLNCRYEITLVNGEHAICFYRNEKLINCQIFHSFEGRVTEIYAIVDASKLKNLHS